MKFLFFEISFYQTIVINVKLFFSVFDSRIQRCRFELNQFNLKQKNLIQNS